MKFTARVESLANVLKQSGRIASDKASDIAGNLLLSAQAGQLDVTAHKMGNST